MSIHTRIAVLEKRHGDGEVTIRVFLSQDGSVLVDGELISQDEFDKRYPDAIKVRAREQHEQNSPNKS